MEALHSTKKPAMQPITQPLSKHTTHSIPTKLLLVVVGFVGLLLTVAPGYLRLNHLISVETMRSMIFTGIVLWCISAILWRRKEGEDTL